MTRSRARTSLALLVIAAVVGVGLWQVSHLRSQTSTDGTDAGVGLTIYRGDEAITLPRIEGTTIDGQALDLADLRGRVVVLNVWGSWCGPCRAEAPDLVAVSNETATRGVQFVGVNVRDNLAAARAFVRTYQIAYPSFDDQDGLVLARFNGIIPVSAVPSTLVVDREGAIRARVVGTVDATTLRGLIEDAEQTG